MSSETNRMEIAAYHEAGHCVVARVLGLEIKDEGCHIKGVNDGTAFLGGAAINMDDCDPRDAMVTAIAGATAGHRRAILLSAGCGELNVNAADHRAAYDMSVEMMFPDISAVGDGNIATDVEFIIDRMPELSADTNDRRKIVAGITVAAIVGLDRDGINGLGTEALPVSDEWYAPLREATDRAVALVWKHWDIVDALAKRLLEVRHIPGPELIAFLDNEKCPVQPQCGPTATRLNAQTPRAGRFTGTPSKSESKGKTIGKLSQLRDARERLDSPRREGSAQRASAREV